MLKDEVLRNGMNKNGRSWELVFEGVRNTWAKTLLYQYHRKLKEISNKMTV